MLCVYESDWKGKEEIQVAYGVRGSQESHTTENGRLLCDWEISQPRGRSDERPQATRRANDTVDHRALVMFCNRSRWLVETDQSTEL